jgi:hypothetical protein
MWFTSLTVLIHQNILLETSKSHGERFLNDTSLRRRKKDKWGTTWIFPSQSKCSLQQGCVNPDYTFCEDEDSKVEESACFIRKLCIENTGILHTHTHTHTHTHNVGSTKCQNYVRNLKQKNDEHLTWWSFLLQKNCTYMNKQYLCNSTLHYSLYNLFHW